MPDLTMAKLAELTGRHVDTLRRLARTNRLPGSYRLGNRWLITQEAADRLRGLAPVRARPRLTRG